jgi:hypothetical protein
MVKRDLDSNDNDTKLIIMKNMVINWFRYIDDVKLFDETDDTLLLPLIMSAKIFNILIHNSQYHEFNVKRPLIIINDNLSFTIYKCYKWQGSNYNNVNNVMHYDYNVLSTIAYYLHMLSIVDRQNNNNFNFILKLY